MSNFDRRVDAQSTTALGATLARGHSAQVGVCRGMKVLARRKVLNVVVLSVRAANQVRAAFERFVDKQNRLAGILHVARPFDAQRAEVSGGRLEQVPDFVLLHGPRFFARNRSRELGFA